MPLFVSAHTVQSIVGYYERQQYSSLDHLCHLAYRLKCFIIVQLQHVMYALYFAMIVQQYAGQSSSSSSSRTAGTVDCKLNKNSSYGSINSAITCSSSSSISSGCGSSSDVCIAIEASERTPLLLSDDSSTLEPQKQPPMPMGYDGSTGLNCRAIGLLALLSMGLCLASYLLWRQSHFNSTGYSLHLIEHSIWSQAGLPSGAMLESSSVLSVYITHTHTAECWNADSCVALLHDIQHFQAANHELPYNFLIGGDCQTYEARGWQYASGFTGLPQLSSLVLAFVGNFVSIMPRPCQLEAAQALLWESVKRHKLQQQYALYALHNASDTLTDAAALQQRISQWPGYGGAYKVR